MTLWKDVELGEVKETYCKTKEFFSETIFERKGQEKG
jgi:hypothetical protein